MPQLHLQIIDKPIPWRRTRGQGPRRFKDAGTKNWEASAIWQLREQVPAGWTPLSCPLSLSLRAVFARPKRLTCEHRRQPCSCPPAVLRGDDIPHDGLVDLDNLVKRAGDTLQRAGIVENDRLIWRLVPPLEKVYGPPGCTPGMYIGLHWKDPA